MQASASYTGLLLACPRPFDPENDDEREVPGEPARYGSAFHQVIAACLRPSKKALEKTPAYAKEIDKAAATYSVKASAGELAGHVKSSVGVLRNWLTREKLEVLEVERAYAVKPFMGGSWNARLIAAHSEEHTYEVEPGELPGTVDLIAASANRKRLAVIDHKTGGGESDTFAQPAKIPQMRTLGLVAPFAPTRGTNDVDVDVEVGVFHADRRGLPAMYTEPYDLESRIGHAIDLHTALSAVGSGFLRPGPHCARCPIRLSCPAHKADLLAESTAALVRSANAVGVEPIVGQLVSAAASKLSVEQRAGALYELLQKFKVLEKAGRDEIRRLVKGGSIIETSDGKTLEIRTQTYETLSKKSVLEALGPVEGEKVLKTLRKKGAIRETTRESLVGGKG